MPSDSSVSAKVKGWLSASDKGVYYAKVEVMQRYRAGALKRLGVATS